jgi:hypothetical protein
MFISLTNVNLSWIMLDAWRYIDMINYRANVRSQAANPSSPKRYNKVTST